MKITEILSEGRDAPLYHMMGEQKAAYVFTKDAMPARWTHNIPGVGKVSGNSFSRNKFLQQEENMVVRITVDQSQLARRHKIVPLNANLIHGFTQHTDFLNDYGMDPETISQYRARKDEPDDRLSLDKDRFDEEFVIGDINQIHRYITAIELWGDLNYIEDNGKFLVPMFNYARQFNIPLSIPQEAQKLVDKLLARQSKNKK